MSFTTAISKHRIPFKENKWLRLFIGVFAIIWADSFIGNTDTANWILENVLTFIFILTLLFTYRKYQFSTLTYLLVCVYLCLHVYGSKYTYAENPFGYCCKIP